MPPRRPSTPRWSAYEPDRGRPSTDVERETPAPAPEREAAAAPERGAVPAEHDVIPSEVERQNTRPGVEREAPSTADERGGAASDVERQTPDLWSNPREPRGE